MKKTIIAAAVILALTGCEENPNLTPKERAEQEITYKIENQEEYADMVVATWTRLIGGAESSLERNARYWQHLDYWHEQPDKQTCRLLAAENKAMKKLLDNGSSIYPKKWGYTQETYEETAREHRSCLKKRVYTKWMTALAADYEEKKNLFK